MFTHQSWLILNTINLISTKDGCTSGQITSRAIRNVGLSFKMACFPTIGKEVFLFVPVSSVCLSTFSLLQPLLLQEDSATLTFYDFTSMWTIVRTFPTQCHWTANPLPLKKKERNDKVWLLTLELHCFHPSDQFYLSQNADHEDLLMKLSQKYCAWTHALYHNLSLLLQTRMFHLESLFWKWESHDLLWLTVTKAHIGTTLES